MADFFEKLMVGAMNLDKKLHQMKFDRLSTEELTLKRTEMEQRYDIQDSQFGRMGVPTMPIEEIQNYNAIIRVLEKRNVPRPGYITPVGEKFRDGHGTL